MKLLKSTNNRFLIFFLDVNIMTTPIDIKKWIEASLVNSQASVEGDGHHFQAIVICPQFSGKNTLARHRLVYESLGEHMKKDIHALELKTFTYEEKKG